MAQTLRKKFKKIFKKGKASIRDISIITTQYLKDVHEIDISPIKYQRSTKRSNIMLNFMLARQYYNWLWNLGMEMDEKYKPDNPKDGKFFLNSDHVLEKYNAFTDTWIEISEPVLK